MRYARARAALRRRLHAERITLGGRRGVLDGEIIGASARAKCKASLDIGCTGRPGNDLNCHYLVDQKKRDADRRSTLVRFVRGTMAEGGSAHRAWIKT